MALCAKHPFLADLACRVARRGNSRALGADRRTASELAGLYGHDRRVELGRADDADPCHLASSDATGAAGHRCAMESSGFLIAFTVHQSRRTGRWSETAGIRP